MKQDYIVHEGHPILLLFFAGWAADAHPFEHYRPQGCDYMICYDYSDLSFDLSLLSDYEEIRVVGWSMGVWAGAQVIAALGERVTESIAINGTRYPAHDEWGIPTAIFDGTLSGLTEQTYQKFVRRMCGGAEAYRRYTVIAPQRELTDIRAELAHVAQTYPVIGAGENVWRQAVVGMTDQIFPAAAQRRAWAQDGVPVVTMPAAHYDAELFETFLEDIWTKRS